MKSLFLTIAALALTGCAHGEPIAFNWDMYSDRPAVVAQAPVYYFKDTAFGQEANRRLAPDFWDQEPVDYIEVIVVEQGSSKKGSHRGNH